MSEDSRIDSLFHEARALRGDERERFLAAACGDDSALRSRLEALLRSDAMTGDFLGDQASPVGGETLVPQDATRPNPTAVSPPTEAAGTRIGQYKLLEEIGEGGFGSVFMAEQERPVRRLVALKIIKLGMDTREVVARFEQERQALAWMDHPNIAKVFDAGATETGRPYFVMELCRGDPITEYCDKNKLSIDQRLELFVQVCQAVQHAHQKGIIHRDIKPSNVLVTTVDGRPQAKVIDFGIAKAIEGKLTDRTLFTEGWQLIGTPQYMSPEQAGGSLDIDTRTDIYSLGVLLYELLTGTTPFDPKSLRAAAIAEMQRIIREVDPPAPSTQIGTNTETIASVAAQRQIEPKRLGKIVRGELDWIVMKSLDKDRRRRYETAVNFGSDIQNYMSGAPVVAAPATFAYRFGKLVTRNKGPVAAGMAVAMALLIGVIAFAWQAKIAIRQRDRALAAESQATQRASELKAVADFQSSMLGGIDATDAGVALMIDIRTKFNSSLANSSVPEDQRLAQMAAFSQQLVRVNATDTAIDVIDQNILKPAVSAIDKKFKDQPLVAAALCQSIADVYRTLGRLDAATPLQERALDTRTRVLGPNHLETIDSQWKAGRLLRSHGKLPEAAAMLQQAVDRRRALPMADDVDSLDAENELGEVLREQGKLAEAEVYLRSAMDKGRRVLGPDDPDELNFIACLASLLDVAGKRTEAEVLLKKDLEASRRVKGEDSPDTITMISNYGSLLIRLDRADEGTRYLQDVLARQRRVRGNDHPETISAMASLGEAMEAQGQLEQAASIYREALQDSRRVLGDDHPLALRSMNDLSDVLRKQGKLSEAEPLARESMDRYRKVFGDANRETLAAINVYGYVLIEQGRSAEAEPYWREAFEKGKKLFGEDHPDVVIWEGNLGALLLSEHKLAEAEPYLREALAVSRRVSGNDFSVTLLTAHSLAGLLRDRQQYAEAEPLFREIVDSHKRLLGTGNTQTVTSMLQLAGLLRMEGKISEAETVGHEATIACEKANPANHLLESNARLGYGKTLMALKRFPEAETELVKADRLSPAPRIPPSQRIACLTALVTLYQTWQTADPGKEVASKLAQCSDELQAVRATTRTTMRDGSGPLPATLPALR
jgi:serine/threonine protein kinase